MRNNCSVAVRIVRKYYLYDSVFTQFGTLEYYYKFLTRNELMSHSDYA